jgi:protein-S-isoprenylcysteine O-methyltransferase Ste14
MVDNKGSGDLVVAAPLIQFVGLFGRILALSVWGWGSWHGFVSSPARLALVVVTLGLTRSPPSLELERMDSEEWLLADEFGRQHAQYKKKTWRVV